MSRKILALLILLAVPLVGAGILHGCESNAYAVAGSAVDPGQPVGTQVLTVTAPVTHATLAALAAGVQSYTWNLGSTLPNNSRITSCIAVIDEAFTSSDMGSVYVTFSNDLSSPFSSRLTTTNTLNAASFASGSDWRNQNGAQVTAKIEADIGGAPGDLNALTAGGLTATCYYLAP